MEEAAVHLVQRLLSLRENKGFGSGECRAEDFRRRVSVVRRSAASDLVHESPQNLVSSFPLHQVFGFQFSVYDVTWCFISRKPLFLRPQAPRLSDPMGFRRPGRGASPPANPYSFVHKHHVPRVRWAFGGPMRLEKEFFHNRTCFDIVDIRNRFFPNPYMPLQKKGVCP